MTRPTFVSLRAIFVLLLVCALAGIASNARAQYLYDLRSDGTLEWRKHLGSINGIFSWSTPTVAGTGWTGFKQVFPADNGVLYAIQTDGTLRWYKHTGFRDGSITNWSGPNTVGGGWQSFLNVFSGGDGVIYAVATDGTLYWYKHVDQQTGGSTWLGPTNVGSGWNGFTQVFAGQGGSIYGIKPNGDLYWYKHLGRDNGTFNWQGPIIVGNGWTIYQKVFASTDGVIYGWKSDGTLWWYKHLGFLTGAASWLGGNNVGAGWLFNDVFAMGAPIEGYCWPLSVEPGQIIDFSIASPSSYQLHMVRFQRSGTQNPSIAMTSDMPFTATLPATPDSAWQNGCNWPVTYSYEIPANWTSGIYGAECRDQFGHASWVMFIVKPPHTSLGDFAVLANTNTWNSYNTWGGLDKYTSPAAAAVSYLRPNPFTAPSEPEGPTHLTRAELWVQDWLATTGYRFDTYTDIDFHLGIPNLSQYRALIIQTHPEYWTTQMMNNLVAYLAQGGTVIYIAGNGLFEEVTLNGTRQGLFPHSSVGYREPNYFRNLQPTPRPERAILGVQYLGDCWFTFGNFVVQNASHPLFAKTGVVNGQALGANGLNGGSSGWEMDTSIPGTAADGDIVDATLAWDRGQPPAGLQLLARGDNACGYGGDMTYYRTPAGGFVFSAGSLSFGGSLVIDSKLQQVVKNALFLAYHHVTAVGDDAGGATAFTLARNEPNPFGSETLIRYSLSSAGAVRLRVYDVQGREVARLVDRLESAGSHQARWNGLTRRGQPAPAGVYYYKLEEGTKSLNGRMILLR